MSDADKKSDEEDLADLKAVRNGDATAFRAIVAKYQGRIYAMVYGMVRNREDARAITQDTFVMAYNNLDSFILGSSCYTWLYRIATNLATNFLHKRERQQNEMHATRQEELERLQMETDLTEDPDRQRRNRRLYERITNAIKELPPDHQQAILLREFEGLSYKEIAEIMDIPEGTVMSRLFYARKRLKHALNEE